MELIEKNVLPRPRKQCRRKGLSREKLFEYGNAFRPQKRKFRRTVFLFDRGQIAEDAEIPDRDLPDRPERRKIAPFPLLFTR